MVYFEPKVFLFYLNCDSCFLGILRRAVYLCQLTVCYYFTFFIWNQFAFWISDVWKLASAVVIFFFSQVNLQLLATCYLRNDQAYSAYHILKGIWFTLVVIGNRNRVCFVDLKCIDSKVFYVLIRLIWGLPILGYYLLAWPTPNKHLNLKIFVDLNPLK